MWEALGRFHITMLDTRVIRVGVMYAFMCTLDHKFSKVFCLILSALHAKEEVRTTRLMLSVFLATLESTFLVPPTAGSMSCFFGSVTSLINGEAVWKT